MCIEPIMKHGAMVKPIAFIKAFAPWHTGKAYDRKPNDDASLVRNCSAAQNTPPNWPHPSNRPLEIVAITTNVGADRIESPRNPSRRPPPSLHPFPPFYPCAAPLPRLTFQISSRALACAADRTSSMRVTSATRHRIPAETPLKGDTLCRLAGLSVEPYAREPRGAICLGEIVRSCRKYKRFDTGVKPRLTQEKSEYFEGLSPRLWIMRESG
ncbi:hypothetical protein KM043_014485 [Ampulex compressa]|nr:hypothetical protein KM043_014485 [Ampulex compressa]